MLVMGGRRDRLIQSLRTGVHRGQGDQRDTGESINGLITFDLQPHHWGL